MTEVPGLASLLSFKTRNTTSRVRLAAALPDQTAQKRGALMTYYRVEFAAASGTAVRTKRFRTQESARKHVERILGPLDESTLESKVAIVAVSKSGTPDQQFGQRGTA